jgi:hypothetical protein
MRRLLTAVEVALYLAFIADCFVLLAGQSGYLPTGGASLIMLLLLTASVRWLRDHSAAEAPMP